MSVKFFGQYLLEKNVITARQLLEAVELQESKNMRFGEYAMEKGYLNAGDVQRLNSEQKREDMKIGELAVKFNLLASSKVDEILTLQRNDHVFIGEALVESGALSEEAMRKELELFRAEQSDYEAGDVSVPEGTGDPDVVRALVDMAQKMFTRVALLDVKPGSGFVAEREPGENFAMVSVSLTGSVGCRFVLSVPEGVARSIAAGVMGIDAADEPVEIISDSVREFCNIICGNVAAKMAQKGKSVVISPPDEMRFKDGGYGLLQGKRAVCYPLASASGDDIALFVLEG